MKDSSFRIKVSLSPPHSERVIPPHPQEEGGTPYRPFELEVVFLAMMTLKMQLVLELVLVGSDNLMCYLSSKRGAVSFPL